MPPRSTTMSRRGSSRAAASAKRGMKAQENRPALTPSMARRDISRLRFRAAFAGGAMPAGSSARALRT